MTLNIARAASWLHKWLALIVGVQVVFWIASGLFFALSPIERVRSEHRIATVEAASLDLAAFENPSSLRAFLPNAPTRLTFERDAIGHARAVAEFANGRPALIDLEAARVISPLSAQAAAEIARAHVVGSPRILEQHLVTDETPEYRGALPAWRVLLDDREGLAVYVAADTGRVTARRSDLWRLYDALWALHIMDWRDHENFNTGLLIITSITSLIVALAGFFLFPYRLLRRKN